MSRSLKLLRVQILIEKLIKSTRFILSCQIFLIICNHFQQSVSAFLEVFFGQCSPCIWLQEITVALHVFIISCMILLQTFIRVKFLEAMEIWTFFNFVDKVVFVNIEVSERPWMLDEFIRGKVLASL